MCETLNTHNCCTSVRCHAKQTQRERYTETTSAYLLRSACLTETCTAKIMTKTIKMDILLPIEREREGGGEGEI